MSESIFVDGNLPVLYDDEDDPLLPAITPASKLAPASSTPAEGHASSTSSSTAFGPTPVAFDGEIISQRKAPQHIQRRYHPQLMIGDLGERVQGPNLLNMLISLILHLLLLLSPMMLDTLFLIQTGSMSCMKSLKTLKETKFGSL